MYCQDCLQWEADPHWCGVLERNHSLYVYNKKMKEFIAKWKYRGDSVLILAFREHLRHLYFQHYNDFLPVPIPLSSERLLERGFNQSALIASLLIEKLSFEETARLFAKNLLMKRMFFPTSPTYAGELLERVIHEEKQSKKSRMERLAPHFNPFKVKHEKISSIKGEKILLLDDIYTTGSTLRKAALTLKKHGAARVCALTLARS